MSFTFRGGITAFTDTVSPIAAVVPTATVSGDLMFMFICASTTIVPTTPDGFVLLQSSTGHTNGNCYLYQRIAPSDIPLWYFFNWTGGGTVSGYIVSVGATSATPEAYLTAVATTDVANTNKVWTGVTNTVTNTFLMCFMGSGNAASTPDAAMTERIDQGTTSAHVYLMTQTVAASGATGTRTATGSSVNFARTFTVSVKESGSPPTYPPPEADSTAVPVLVELTGSGIESTAVPVLAEVAAIGIYTTATPVYVEVAAVGVYATSIPCLIELEFQEPEPEMPTYFARAAGTRAMHEALPDEVSGYAFDPEYSWWQTIVPEKGRNILSNPSFEQAPYDQYSSFGFTWTVPEFGPVGATSGKSCSKLAVGAFSDNTFDYVGDLTLTAGPYTWSLDTYITRPPFTLKMQVLDLADVIIAQRTFHYAYTGWRRISLTWVELGTGDRKLRLLGPNGVNITGGFLYTDSWQLEAKPYQTTYIDGDMVGFNDLQPNQSFYWEGAPHQSPSVRRANAGAGGRPVAWSEDVGFSTTGVVGLGMGPVEIHTQDMTDGLEYHQSSNEVSRDFTITGRIFAENFSILSEKAREFTRLLRPNNTRNGDVTLLRFQQTDERGGMLGAPLDIRCVYKTGLEGNITNFYQQSFPIQFHASDPFPIETIDSAASLDIFSSLYCNGIIYRDEDGRYQNLGTGTTLGAIERVDWDCHGRPLAVGAFTQVAGAAGEDVMYYEDGAWHQLGTSASNAHYCVDGGWKYGYETIVGGNDGVWAYDEDMDVWEEIANGLNGPTLAVLRDVDGTVYAGGTFTDNGDASNASLKYIGFTPLSDGNWYAMGAGLKHSTLSPQVNALLLHEGYLYVGGVFDAADGGGGPDIPLNYVGRWNIATLEWDNMGPGFNDRVNGLALSEDGFIYATGPFTRDGGDDFDLRGIARWNGTTWEEPFILIDESAAYGADGMVVDEHGVMWFFKDETSSDQRFDVSDTIGVSETFGWKNGVFYPSFVRNSQGLWWLAVGPGDRTLFGILRVQNPAVANVEVPAMNEIEYSGDANAPIAIHFNGPVNPIHILCLDNGGGVYFLPTLQVGENEDMVVRTDLQRALMYSEARSNLYRYMSSGPSSSLLIYLRPGTNHISIFGEGDEGTSWVIWRNRYWGIEAASTL